VTDAGQTPAPTPSGTRRHRGGRGAKGGPGAGNARTGVDRTRVAAYAVCLDEGGRVLLCHIAPSVGVGDVWTLPGGGLDFGEPPDVAVLRELTEETGYTGELDGLIGVSDRVFTDVDGADRLHAIRILYRVRLVGGELRDEPDGSTDTCAWFAPSEARRLRLGELARFALDLERADRAR
jgi:8-oxo-dGTP diphosphatase